MCSKHKLKLTITEQWALFGGTTMVFSIFTIFIDNKFANIERPKSLFESLKEYSFMNSVNLSNKFSIL